VRDRVDVGERPFGGLDDLPDRPVPLVDVRHEVVEPLPHVGVRVDDHVEPLDRPGPLVGSL